MKIETMKPEIFYILLILFICSISGFAQDQNNNSAPNDKQPKKGIEIESIDKNIYDKVYVPDKTYIGKIPLYSPSTTCGSTNENNVIENNVIVVKAQKGDTVETIAKHYGADPIVVAKFNGLFTKTKLNVGREIRIPTK